MTKIIRKTSLLPFIFFCLNVMLCLNAHALQFDGKMYYSEWLIATGQMVLYGIVVCLVFLGILKFISVLIKNAFQIKSRCLDVIVLIVGLILFYLSSKVFFFAEFFLPMVLYICFPLLGISCFFYVVLKKKCFINRLELKSNHLFGNILVYSLRLFLFTLITTLIYIASFSAFFYGSQMFGCLIK